MSRTLMYVCTDRYLLSDNRVPLQHFWAERKKKWIETKNDDYCSKRPYETARLMGVRVLLYSDGMFTW